VARNVQPIFTAKPRNGSNDLNVVASTLITAANDTSGVSVNNQLIFTANTLHGGIPGKIRIASLGTNVASLVRFFLNNGSDPTVAANNAIIGEVGLPPTTISTTVPMPFFDFAIPDGVQAGWRVYAGLSVNVAAGWKLTPFGGSYDDA
jgi:hypothetical protein